MNTAGLKGEYPPDIIQLVVDMSEAGGREVLASFDRYRARVKGEAKDIKSGFTPEQEAALAAGALHTLPLDRLLDSCAQEINRVPPGKSIEWQAQVILFLPAQQVLPMLPLLFERITDERKAELLSYGVGIKENHFDPEAEGLQPINEEKLCQQDSGNGDRTINRRFRRYIIVPKRPSQDSNRE